MWSPILLSLLLLNPVYTAKILGVFHMSSRSHYILGSSLMRALADRGHDVTVISPFGENDPPKNGTYRDIVLTGVAEQHDKRVAAFNMFEKRTVNPFIMVPFMAKLVTTMTEEALNNTEVLKLIASDEKFDLVILEEFVNAAHKAFAAHFGANLVVLSTVGAGPWVNDLVGNPTPLAYVPDMLLGYSSPMTFGERLTNTVNYVWNGIIKKVMINPSQQQLIDKYFPGGYKLEDVTSNVSLVLLNSHPSINQPVPYVPQMVDIGGFHVKPPKKLPKHLQDYIDNSKTGVIYFSLGSNIKSILLPEEKRQALINTFKQLKYDILWKWEDDNLPDKPPNVRTEKWLPQQDILAHPNVKLFITHAGLLSTIEIIYHGIPVLALPIGADQNLNAKQIENHKVGLALSFHDVTTETLLEKIQQVLGDPQYRKNSKARSEFFHDRLVKPMDSAMYWIEYVLRHGGTSHLRVAAVDLAWWQYLLLDVVLVVLLVGVVGVYVVWKVVGVVCWRKGKKEKVKRQ